MRESMYYHTKLNVINLQSIIVSLKSLCLRYFFIERSKRAKVKSIVHFIYTYVTVRHKLLFKTTDGLLLVPDLYFKIIGYFPIHLVYGPQFGSLLG